MDEDCSYVVNMKATPARNSCVFFLMIRRPPRSTLDRSSAASDVYKRQVLTQGLNRQIRRMCEALGYNVVSLKRTRIMNMTLGNLPLGKWRFFTPDEIETINLMLKNSSKTADGAEAISYTHLTLPTSDLV